MNQQVSLICFYLNTTFLWLVNGVSLDTLIQKLQNGLCYFNISCYTEQGLYLGKNIEIGPKKSFAPFWHKNFVVMCV